MTKTSTVRTVSLAALVVALAVSPVAIAARGGNGNGASISFSSAGASTSSSATALSVGQQYQVNGSGFKPNTWVTVGAHYSDMTWWNSGITDSQGNFSFTFNATSSGQIYHEAKEMQNNDSFRVRAEATLSVNG